KNMSEDIMNLCMWNNYFRGKDGNGVWVWGREIENDTNPLYCQPEAVYALAKSALDVNRVAEYVEPFSHIKGEYAVFYGGSDLENFYIGADFNDINFDFLTNTQAEKGKIDYKLIFIMDDATVSEKAMANIKSSGAKIIKVKSYKNYKDYYRQVKAETENCKKLVDINKWGIECRSYEKDGKIYYYLMNYTKKPVKITLPKESRDMLTGKTYKKIEVQPAGVYLFECQK
ncbi:MAG: Beta-galactosidase C-terminal domain, partial [Armatimonadetes bacterium]|nr:Beta-galactosidase C-terminal domain [Candidatus Hippobium faecium]